MLEAIIKKKRKDKPKAEQSNAKIQEPKERESSATGSDVVDMNKTKCQEDYSTAQKGSYFHDLWSGFKRHLRDPKFFMELLALFGLAFYTYETTRTNNLTQTALDISKRQFVTDQRPYIWVKPGDTPIAANQQLTWDLVFDNYGKSPAVNVRKCIYFDTVYPEESYKGNENAVPPIEIQLQYYEKTRTPPRSQEECRLSPGQQITSGVIPPQFPVHNTLHSERELTEADVRVMSRRDGNVFAWGTFFYDDISGNHYTSIFCAFRLATGASMYCPKWNEIK